MITENTAMITTQFGYYIIHMIDNSTARYENAIEEAIATKRHHYLRYIIINC